MTWQLASFALLFGALGIGFAWYEHSHPTSRVLALVATLAALAALGRIAFAALPNVKPTTDIVFLSGFALGAAPGFAVGAVGALTSNFFFGQGPWTPWEMAAWGLCGVLGAIFGAVTRRRAPRIPLALACGVAGLVYGLILDLSLWVPATQQHTLSYYLSIEARSLPFNIAHAVGNIVFCLAFGPALARQLLRFRRRFEPTWRPLAAPHAASLVVAVLAASTLAALALGAASPARTEAASTPAARAIAYLRRAQNADGGFGAAARRASDPLYTGWVVIGLAAAGTPPAHVVRGGASPVAYLLRSAGSQKGTGDLERTILALAAGGHSPRHAAGHDLVKALDGRPGRDASFGGQVNLAAYGILALRAAGAPTGNAVIRRAAAWVARQQNSDGGFSFARRGSPSGIDDTAGALEGLMAAGRSPGSSVARRAAAYLERHQGADGGFPLSPHSPSNSQSTAFAVQALLAAHVDPDRLHRGGARTPLAYLRTLQAGDGSVRYSRTSAQTPVWVTAEVLAAFARRPLPVGPAR